MLFVLRSQRCAVGEAGGRLSHCSLVLYRAILSIPNPFFFTKTLRWQWLLSPVRLVALRHLWPAMMAGVALNYLVFGYLGEFLRVFLLGRQSTLSKSAVLGSVMVERFLDAITVVFLLGLGWVLADGQLPAGYLLLALSVAALVFAAALITYGSEMGLTVVRRLLSVFSHKRQSVLMESVSLGLEGMHALSKPNLLLGVTGLSVALWLPMAAANYIAMLALGIDVPFFVTFTAMALSILGTTLPSSPGHVGVIEFCYVESLKPYGVDPSHAFAAALFFHILLYLPVTVGVPWFLRLSGVTFGQARHAAEAANEVGTRE
jgi:glycosyltransferase 2 family protein